MKWTAYRDTYLSYLTLHGSVTHARKAREVLTIFTRYLRDIRDDRGQPIVELEQLTNSVYTQYLARRKQDGGKKRGTLISPATINGDIRYLNTAFSMALAPTNREPNRLGLAAAGWDPPHSKMLKEPHPRPRVLNEKGLERLLSACSHATLPRIEGCKPSVWWQALWLVAYTTGLRCKALLTMPRPTPEDIEASTIRLPWTADKSGQERVFHLHDVVAELIGRIPHSPDGRLFAWPHCREWFYAQVHRMQSKHGIPRVEHATPHDMRRTKATNLIIAGQSLAIVQREMGHADPAVTARHYVGLLTNERRDAVKALPMPSLVKPAERRQLELFPSN